MLYNRLSDTELERAVFIDLHDTAARNEMIRRTTALMDTRSDEFQDLEMQLETAEKEHASAVANIEEELQVSERRAGELQHRLDRVIERISQLTRAEDLV